MSPPSAGLGAMLGLQPPAAPASRSTPKMSEGPSFEQCLHADQTAAAKVEQSAPSVSRSRADVSNSGKDPQAAASLESPDTAAPRSRRPDQSESARTKPETTSPSTPSTQSDSPDTADEADQADLAQAQPPSAPQAVIEAPAIDAKAVTTPELSADASGIAQLMASLLSMAPAKPSDPASSQSDTAPAKPAAAASITAADASLSGLVRLKAMPPDVSAASPPAVEEGSAAMAPSALLPERAALSTADLSLNLLPAPPTVTPTTAPPLATALPASSLSAPAPGQWAEPLAERVLWMLGDSIDGQPMQGLRQARIELHPAEWGAMQIRVELNADGRTKVSFDVETPQARAAIEASLPQLRDLLGTQSVHSAAPSFELSGGWSHQQRPGGCSPAPASTSHEDSAEAVVVTPLRVSRGLVDQFA